jgi:hypothetical protein
VPARTALKFCRALLAVLTVSGLLAASALAASELVATPDEVDFGIPLSGSDTVKTVTVKNNGPDVLLGDVYLVGDVDNFDFVDSSCQPDWVIGADSTCTVSLSFSPFFGELFDYEAFLVVEGGEEDTPAVARLSGKSRPPGRLVSNVASVDFGALAAGKVSAPKTIRIHNDGGTRISIDSIYARGPFRVTWNGCGKATSLAPLATCELKIVYGPWHTLVTNEYALQRQALSVRTRVESQKLSIPLSGTALQASGEPYPSRQEVEQAMRRNLGRIARATNRLMRGGPKRTLALPRFKAPVEGTLGLTTYGRVGRRKVLLATTTANATRGALRVGLQVHLTAAGRRLLRGAKPVAVRSVIRFRSTVVLYPFRESVTERATVRPERAKRKRS